MRGAPWWSRFPRRGASRAELAEELAYHLAALRARYEARGCSPEEARRLASGDFGPLPAVADDCDDSRRGRWIEELGRDIRYSVRRLWRAPGHTAGVLALLALGIGTSASIFSLVHAVLIQPLGFANEPEVVRVLGRSGAGEEAIPLLSVDAYQALASAPEFRGVGGYGPGQEVLRSPAGTLQIRAERLTASMFAVLGVAPSLGRSFTSAEERADAPVLVLSHGFWQREFGGDSAIIGTVLQLERGPATVIGVMPPGFSGPRLIPSDLWTPLVPDRGVSARLGTRSSAFTVYARLAPKIDRVRAEALVTSQLAARGLSLSEAPLTGIRLEALRELVVGDARTPLLILMGAVGLVLILAAVNVVVLFLVRGEHRRREFQIRTALGATRSRQVRQLVVESALLGIGGGLGGALVAVVTIGLIRSSAGDVLARADTAGPGGATALFTIGVALGMGLLAGLWPALRMTRPDAVTAMPGGHGPAVSGGLQRRALRSTLIGLEMALSAMLLLGAGLMIRSFVQVWPRNPGFATEGRLVLTVQLSGARLEAPEAKARYLATGLAELAALPNVSAVASSSFLPMTQMSALGQWVSPTTDPGSRPPTFHLRSISPRFFDVMGITLQAGRDFAESDRQGASPVAILNREAADRFWPGVDPIGRPARLAIGRDTVSAQIVGIVSSTRLGGLDTRARPEVFVPVAQRPGPWVNFVVRVASIHPGLAAEAVARLVAMDREVARPTVTSLASIAADAVAIPRFYLLVMGTLGVLGLVLAIIGIYSVLSYLVAMRRGELGIRMALGATPGNLRRAVLLDLAFPALAGLGAGTVLALAQGGLLQNLLFEIKPQDPLVFGIVPAGLLVVAALAALIPARRASRTDPAIVLRSG